MTEPTADVTEGQRDLLVSYNKANRDWVEGHLVPRLEREGLKLFVDYRDLPPGENFIIWMENAVEKSRHTLIVLTRAWVNAQWTNFEQLLVQTIDPIGRGRKLIPLLLERCEVPRRISWLSYVDFTEPATQDRELERLLNSLRQPGGAVENGPGKVLDEHTGRSVRQGLRALLELMQSPEVRGAASDFQRSFESVSEQIELMGAYKNLHEMFHGLEDCTEIVFQLKKRAASDATVWDDLGDSEADLIGQVDDLLKFAEHPPFTMGERPWMQRLDRGRKMFSTAMEERAFDQLNKASEILSDVIGGQLSRLNTRLVTSAEVLSLPSLIRSLRFVRQSIPDLGLDPAVIGQVEELQKGVDALDQLNEGLTMLVHNHNFLQQTDDYLDTFNAALLQDLDEFSLAWQDVRTTVRELRGDEDWLMKLRSIAGGLDDVLTSSNNPVKVKRLFQNFRSTLGRSFQQVDHDLLGLCGEMQKLGKLLSLVLRMMQNG